MNIEAKKNVRGSKRYECITEPTDTWMVFDTVTCMPASIGGLILIGCEYRKAEAACLILERIHDAGLQNENGGGI